MANKFPEIKKENQGKFTAWVKKNMKGKDNCSAASAVMANKDDYSKSVVEMANYANNFGCKSKGGPKQKSEPPKGKKKLPPFLEYDKNGKVVKKKK